MNLEKVQRVSLGFEPQSTSGKGLKGRNESTESHHSWYAVRPDLAKFRHFLKSY